MVIDSKSKLTKEVKSDASAILEDLDRDLKILSQYRIPE